MGVATAVTPRKSMSMLVKAEKNVTLNAGLFDCSNKVVECGCHLLVFVFNR